MSPPVAPSAVVARTMLSRVPPASMSAWVTVWTALQVVVSVGARVVTKQDGAASVLVSDRARPVSVTSPVFVTVYSYGTSWPAAVTSVVVELLSMASVIAWSSFVSVHV